MKLVLPTESINQSCCSAFFHECYERMRQRNYSVTIGLMYTISIVVKYISYLAKRKGAGLQQQQHKNKGGIVNISQVATSSPRKSNVFKDSTVVEI